MKRLAVLTVLLTIGSVCLATQLSAPSLAIQQVKENLYLITGAGGNTAAFITEKGVVIVDTKLPDNGPAILEKVKSVTTKPVIMVINTHTHGDHVGSNNAFTGNVEFVAHQKCKAGMQKMPAFQAASEKKFLPSKTFTDQMSLLSGSDQIDLYYFGRGHTDGDALIVFPVLRTMHSGDLFAGKAAPNIDTANGGSGVDYADTLVKAAAGIKGVDTVIPGHSPVTTWSSFQEYGEYLKELVSGIRELKKQGKTDEQAAAELKLPAKYDSYVKTRLKDAVNKIYAELK